MHKQVSAEKRALLRELRAIRALLLLLIVFFAGLLGCAIPIGVILWISILGK
jgi:hypothetical protein